jgi:uncharacterized protein YjbI with pentapeptide repeats
MVHAMGGNKLNVDWQTCGVADCIGVDAGLGGRCLAHLDSPSLATVLEALSPGQSLDARGVRFDEELLSTVLNAFRDEDKFCTLRDARFSWAQFTGKASFFRVKVQGFTAFDNAVFDGDAWFADTQFEEYAWFDKATFRGEAQFSDAVFNGPARFEQTRFGISMFMKTQFKGRVTFEESTFDGQAWFRNARFESDASFERATFRGEAEFSEAVFCGSPRFEQTRFGSGMFTKAQFKGSVTFHESTFDGQAWFTEARFEDTVDFNAATLDLTLFSDAQFEGTATFEETTFQSSARFSAARFNDDFWCGAKFTKGADFARVRFGGLVSFGGSIFSGPSFFTDATFTGLAFFERVIFDFASFEGARFESTAWLGPIIAKQLFLERCVWVEPAQVQVVATDRIVCNGSKFPSGGYIRVAQAALTLEGAQFPVPCFVGDDSETFPWDRFLPEEEDKPEKVPVPQVQRPAVLSMERADLAGLVLTGVSLRSCRFTGAHNLDKLRLEGGVEFAGVPSNWHWMRRQTLAEEHAWRAAHEKGTRRLGWSAHERWSTDQWAISSDRMPDAGEIANLYRSLRKGREDNKDEPGAADFYYGEMEMRRRASATPRSEQFILWLYWLTSGYALRAWRALATLLLTILVISGLFVAFGFDDTSTAADTSFLGAAIFSFRTAIGLLRDPQPTLTLAGDVLQIVLRLAAPVLLGLAVLSVRGRIKR